MADLVVKDAPDVAPPAPPFLTPGGPPAPSLQLATASTPNGHRPVAEHEPDFTPDVATVNPAHLPVPAAKSLTPGQERKVEQSAHLLGVPKSSLPAFKANMTMLAEKDPKAVDKFHDTLAAEAKALNADAKGPAGDAKVKPLPASGPQRDAAIEKAIHATAGKGPDGGEIRNILNSAVATSNPDIAPAPMPSPEIVASRQAHASSEDATMAPPGAEEPTPTKTAPHIGAQPAAQRHAQPTQARPIHAAEAEKPAAPTLAMPEMRAIMNAVPAVIGKVPPPEIKGQIEAAATRLNIGPTDPARAAFDESMVALAKSPSSFTAFNQSIETTANRTNGQIPIADRAEAIKTAGIAASSQAPEALKANVTTAVAAVATAAGTANTANAVAPAPPGEKSGTPEPAVPENITNPHAHADNEPFAGNQAHATAGTAASILMANFAAHEAKTGPTLAFAEPVKDFTIAQPATSLGQIVRAAPQAHGPDVTREQQLAAVPDHAAQPVGKLADPTVHADASIANETFATRPELVASIVQTLDPKTPGVRNNIVTALNDPNKFSMNDLKDIHAAITDPKLGEPSPDTRGNQLLMAQNAVNSPAASTAFRGVVNAANEDRNAHPDAPSLAASAPVQSGPAAVRQPVASNTTANSGRAADATAGLAAPLVAELPGVVSLPAVMGATAAAAIIAGADKTHNELMAKGETSTTAVAIAPPGSQEKIPDAKMADRKQPDVVTAPGAAPPVPSTVAAKTDTPEKVTAPVTQADGGGGGSPPSDQKLAAADPGRSPANKPDPAHPELHLSNGAVHDEGLPTVFNKALTTEFSEGAQSGKHITMVTYNERGDATETQQRIYTSVAGKGTNGPETTIGAAFGKGLSPDAGLTPTYRTGATSYGLNSTPIKNLNMAHAELVPPDGKAGDAPKEAAQAPIHVAAASAGPKLTGVKVGGWMGGPPTA